MPRNLFSEDGLSDQNPPFSGQTINQNPWRPGVVWVPGHHIENPTGKDNREHRKTTEDRSKVSREKTDYTCLQYHGKPLTWVRFSWCRKFPKCALFWWKPTAPALKSKFAILHWNLLFELAYCLGKTASDGFGRNFSRTVKARITNVRQSLHTHA